MLQERLADDVVDLRVLRVVEVDDDQAGVAADVGVGADDRDAAGAVEHAVRVEGHLALEEVVERVAVDRRAAPTRIRPSHLSAT